MCFIRRGSDSLWCSSTRRFPRHALLMPPAAWILPGGRTANRHQGARFHEYQMPLRGNLCGWEKSWQYQTRLTVFVTSQDCKYWRWLHFKGYLLGSCANFSLSSSSFISSASQAAKSFEFLEQARRESGATCTCRSLLLGWSWMKSWLKAVILEPIKQSGCSRSRTTGCIQ